MDLDPTFIEQLKTTCAHHTAGSSGVRSSVEITNQGNAVLALTSHIPLPSNIATNLRSAILGDFWERGQFFDSVEADLLYNPTSFKRVFWTPLSKIPFRAQSGVRMSPAGELKIEFFPPSDTTFPFSGEAIIALPTPCEENNYFTVVLGACLNDRQRATVRRPPKSLSSVAAMGGIDAAFLSAVNFTTEGTAALKEVIRDARSGDSVMARLLELIQSREFPFESRKLPLPNVYGSGAICLGDVTLSAMAPVEIQEASPSAWADKLLGLFNQTAWNRDLFPDNRSHFEEFVNFSSDGTYKAPQDPKFFTAWPKLPCFTSHNLCAKTNSAKSFYVLAGQAFAFDAAKKALRY